jgi:hypothetical protein
MSSPPARILRQLLLEVGQLLAGVRLLLAEPLLKFCD